MSATVTYKGATLTTATNQTRTLDTAGTYLEDDITITDVTTIPTGTKNISITANGTTTEDVTSYATASITTAVPASAVDSGTKSISISSNGTTTHDVVGYASASITAAVPNSYSASDEGKVVSSGALVSQTSDTVTENDTYDTTLINSLTVNVSGGGGTQIGIETPKANLLSMLYALEQGTAKTGTFTLSTTLPSTKQVIFDADDSTVKNFAIFEQNIGVEILESNNIMSKMRFWLYDESTSARTFFSVTDRVRASYKDYVTATPSNVDLTSTYYDNSYWFFEDGVLSAQGQYNKHSQYTPFRANVVYRWIAW